MLERDREINQRFCPECSTGILEPHHEYRDQVKCCICGFTKLKDKARDDLKAGKK